MSVPRKTPFTCGYCWLMVAVLCPVVASAQTTLNRSNPHNLPDAPSASAAALPQARQLAQNSPNQAQSWWLLAPAEAQYRPLTNHEKFMSFVHHTFSPYTLATAMYDTTWAHAIGDPKAYGGGMEGWGKRLGAAAAGTESRSFFGTFLFPTLLHQDPRYFAMYKGPVRKRALHAISRVFVIRNDDGSNSVNTSGLLTIAVTESLCTAWTPEGQRTAGKTFTRMLGAMQGDATTYLLHEFTPDILRVFKRHAPQRLRRIEEKMPAMITGDTTR